MRRHSHLRPVRRPELPGFAPAVITAGAKRTPNEVRVTRRGFTSWLPLTGVRASATECDRG
ncbi:hypothetical protein BAY61_08935 [Prauserella marina]|nr:hypothetical protein BAY61_08935 [Prauserella marina]